MMSTLTHVFEYLMDECMRTRLGHFCEQQREKCLFLHDLILEMRSDVIYVCVFTTQKNVSSCINPFVVGN